MKKENRGGKRIPGEGKTLGRPEETEERLTLFRRIPKSIFKELANHVDKKVKEYKASK